MDIVIDQNRPELGGNLRHGDMGTWCPDLWRALVEIYAVRSALDVGCGEGHAAAFINRIGVFCLGVDGLDINIKRAVFPIALHDLLTAPFIMPVDLVWSCEVAEHIPESFVDNYIDTLANGRVIAMSHAQPGQPGHHHVNCQNDEYWVAKMRSRGYQLADSNEFFRTLALKSGGGQYFYASGLVFLRN